MPNLKFKIDLVHIKNYKAYQKIHHMSDRAHTNIKHVLNILSNKYTKNRLGLSTHKTDEFIEFKINQFLKFPSYETALDIIGLGPGLTPLGDDVFLGYLMGIKTLGNDYPWVKKIIENIKYKTNQFSLQNIMDTYLSLYPTIYIDMIEEIFNNNDLKNTLKVLDIGHTSGPGIINGFICGLQEGVKK